MTLMISVFLAVLIAGVPVFIALAGSTLIYTHFVAHIPDFVILHRMAGGIDSFPLLAVPFFILAGNLMNSAGITNRIYDFAVALVGWMRGGLASRRSGFGSSSSARGGSSRCSFRPGT